MKKTLAGDLKEISGKVAIENGQPVKIQNLIVSALMAPRQEDTPEQKLTDFRLAERVQTGEEADYSAEELARIKLVVGKFFAPLVVGRVYELIGDEK